jgi:hypothetical protein
MNNPERGYDPIRIDEIMRRPATEFKGPNDPDLDEMIKYLRYIRMKHQKLKQSEIADEEVDPELWKVVAEGRRISKPNAFRRF